MKQLGSILLEEGILTEDQLMDAIDAQQQRGQSLGRTLVELGMITEAQLVRALASQVGMQFVELADYQVDRSAVALVSAQVCRRHVALPIGFEDGQLKLAMSNPGNVVAVDDFQTLTNMKILPVVATHDDLQQAIDRYCRADHELEDLQGSMEEEVVEDLSDMSAVIEDDAPIVRFVNLLITQAIQDRASDIHIEPGEKDLRVRYRIDGVLHEMQRAAKSIQNGVISRLKIMADMDIAERRKPQDGRLSVTHQGQKIDLRVAALPTVWGEKIVMRVLDNSTAAMELADLGIREHNYEIFAASFTKPYGMILVTGPTGSGKSTTLYATLNQISRPEINVITVEDPVEYRIEGINQVQVNVKAGLTFAGALRSILRADPDVVLLGEIRDHETAQIAIEAALTGHLVLSTLHTNDAPSAITRLIEMDIEPFLVGSAVDCVVAQRLARRVCQKCCQPYTPLPAEIARFGWEGPQPPSLVKAVGCNSCSNTGYRGRVALHEIMPVNEEIERLAVERASSASIQRAAEAAGMQTLIQDGWAKAQDGLTTVEELLRVVK
ncbi:ATPase, T2SS/T4P/T4SS family [Demequina capsici]|uniref:ATPase, T2SS/T4P/T4SS family n=1 Tax=Demequina capsici TaxID=3075620 RepID=A0AA96JEJ4_9MICO|nr:MULTISPECIES: ATPase, T2SS/T4P/T4SS family [unclassified Demequina]WNM25769.1 ATPase, T2SS/T4P/T4SS family [Demequina sp. OYTSA14]WNM28665.1 ATPase, T2SS/T4P/T4SS family [Demequina sp. PMTSA13]